MGPNPVAAPIKALQGIKNCCITHPERFQHRLDRITTGTHKINNPINNQPSLHSKIVLMMTVSVTYPREQTAGFGGPTICPNFPPSPPPPLPFLTYPTLQLCNTLTSCNQSSIPPWWTSTTSRGDLKQTFKTRGEKLKLFRQSLNF